MPKETVYGDDKSDVVVQWGEDVVQLGSVRDDGFDAVIAMVNEWLERAAMPRIDPEKLRAAWKPPAQPHYDGWFANITRRRQLNELIQILRRARDGAFGRDA